MVPFIGQVSMFGFNFAPRGWALCDGQLLPISSNTALFSLIGTIYGGDGRTTMALPDLRGRAPIHEGHGPGLSTRPIGQRSGAQTTTLSVANMPAHNHQMYASNANGDQFAAGGSALAAKAQDVQTGQPTDRLEIYNSSGNVNNPMKAGSIGNTGSSVAFNNMQPYLTVNFCIALQGLYPSRS